MSYQLRIWSANFESVSPWVWALKHVENRPEVEDSQPLNTQPNGERTVVGIFFRSVSKYSIGQTQWNISWTRIISRSPWLYFCRGIGSKWGYSISNDSASITSVPTFRIFLTNGLTTKAGQEPPEWTGVNFNSKICVSLVWCELIPWTVSFKGEPCTFNFLTSFPEIHELLHAEPQRIKTFSVWKDGCKLASVIYSRPLRVVTESIPRLSSALFITRVTLLAVVSPISSVFSRRFWRKIILELRSKILWVLGEL